MKLDIRIYNTIIFPQMDGTVKTINIETAESVISRWNREDNNDGRVEG